MTLEERIKGLHDKHRFRATLNNALALAYADFIQALQREIRNNVADPEVMRALTLHKQQAQGAQADFLRTAQQAQSRRGYVTTEEAA